MIDLLVAASPPTTIKFDESYITPSGIGPKAPDVPAFAVPLTAFALFVHAHHFGWPDPARVREVTNALMYELPDGGPPPPGVEVR